MTKTIGWAVVMTTLVGLIQSTLLARLSIWGCVPDLALMILIYVSYLNGTLYGQTLGFSSGLILDFISAAPLGFNSFVRFVLGAVFGLLKGNFFLDFVILPILLCIAGTLGKALIIWGLNFLFVGMLPHYSFASSKLWVEAGLNAVCAPFFFAFLNLFKGVLRPRKES